MIRFIDDFLNSITMYRLVLYGLLLEALLAVIFGFLGLLSYSGVQLLFSAVILTLVCFITNSFIATLLKAQVNSESFAITALILFFILTPPSIPSEVMPLLWAGVFATVSKYVFAIRKKHIFNPAAIAAVLLGMFGSSASEWWVATTVLLPITLIVGLLIVRKIRRFYLFFSFVICSIVSIFAFAVALKTDPFDLLTEIFTSWPLVFFATIMLTEPQTTPPTQRLRIAYGALVGLLFGSQFQFGPIFSTPELALVIGNIFSYIVSPKQKLILTLKNKIQLAPQIYNFAFAKDQTFAFTPGQYLEWTLPHKLPDSRGNRRYFTIASSPTEDEIHLGIRFSESGSSFKKALLAMEKNNTIIASQLAGDFMLPDNTNEKLVFIAGGIGITPFRSMVQYLIDTKQKQDIVLFYASTNSSDFVYKDIFEKARNVIGLKTIYVITNAKNAPLDWSGKVGYITQELMRHEVKDYKERTFYLSGPQAMVNAYKDVLSQLNISKKKVVTDYFPGY